MHARANPSIEREKPEEELGGFGPQNHRGDAERPLEKETDGTVGTERCERTAGRKAYRADHYNRRIATSCLWLLKSRHAKVTMILKATHAMKSLVTSSLSRSPRRWQWQTSWS